MIPTQTIIILVLAIGLLIAFVMIIWMHMRLKKFFRGATGADMEQTIKQIVGNIKELYDLHDGNVQRLDIHDNKLSQSIRGIETVRFNPFPELGSNQSFAIALLNEKGDGVVVSSLYTRERVSVFAKPIKAMRSEYELTEEEKEALTKAKI